MVFEETSPLSPRYRRLCVGVGLPPKTNARCRSVTTAKMSSAFFFFTSTFCGATNRWRRGRDGENGVKRGIKESRGDTRPHCLPSSAQTNTQQTNEHTNAAHTPPPPPPPDRGVLLCRPGCNKVFSPQVNCSS